MFGIWPFIKQHPKEKDTYLLIYPFVACIIAQHYLNDVGDCVRLISGNLNYRLIAVYDLLEHLKKKRGA